MKTIQTTMRAVGFSFLASVLLVSCSISAQKENASNAIVLQGASLFDGTGAEPVGDSVVVIEGRRIACVGTESDCEIPETADLVDVNGKFITPGMIDAHVHFFQTGFFDSRPGAMDVTDTYPYHEVASYQRQNPERYYDTYLCSGVTGVYDVGGMSWSLDLQEEAEKNPDAPHVAAAGTLITPLEDVPFELPPDQATLTLDSKEAGLEAVRYLSALGSTGIKLWSLSMDEGYLKRVEAVAAEAQKQGNQVIAHATALEQAKAALRNGTKLLVHSVNDKPVDEEFIKLAKENKTIYNPTLLVISAYWLAFRAAADIEPLDIRDAKGCVDEKTRQLIKSVSQFKDHPKFTDQVKEQLHSFDPNTQLVNETSAQNLMKVYEAGIPIAVGTDGGNPGTLHGISIFDELEAMQDAGIPAEDLIVMATQNGAKAMRRFDDFGTLEAGKLANLIILDKDPSKDISNMRSRTHVLIKGQLREIGSE